MPKIIQEQLLESVINYLATRPYQEVYKVMPTLMSLPDAPPAAVENSPPTKE